MTSTGIPISFDGFVPYEKLRKAIEDAYHMMDVPQEHINNISWFRSTDPGLCFAGFDYERLLEVAGTNNDPKILQYIFGSKEEIVIDRVKKEISLGNQYGKVQPKGVGVLIMACRIRKESEPIIFFDIMSSGHLSTGYSSPKDPNSL